MNLFIRLLWEILRVFMEPFLALFLGVFGFIVSILEIPKKLYWVFKVHGLLRKDTEK